MINNIISRIVAKACAVLGVVWIRDTQYGIKVINAPFGSADFDRYEKGAQFELPTSVLHMSVDYLSDTYSMLGWPMANSPHFQLASLLHTNPQAELRDSAYFRLARVGRLDRRAAFEPNETIKRNAFATRCRLVLEDKYLPIKVIRRADEWFVADGKHRAAACMVLGVNVRCVDVTEAYRDSYYRSILARMRVSSHAYTRHLQFFEWFFPEDRASGVSQ